jgi:hypothetical protein
MSVPGTQVFGIRAVASDVIEKSLNLSALPFEMVSLSTDLSRVVFSLLRKSLDVINQT